MSLIRDGQRRILRYLYAFQFTLDELDAHRILIKDSDYDDIKTWDPEVCDIVFGKIVGEIERGRCGLDPQLLPWCHRFKCEECPYGERHIDCKNPSSDFAAVLQVFISFKGIPVKKVFSPELYRIMIEIAIDEKKDLGKILEYLKVFEVESIGDLDGNPQGVVEGLSDEEIRKHLEQVRETYGGGKLTKEGFYVIEGDKRRGPFDRGSKRRG